MKRFLLCAVALMGLAISAHAQNWPERPIKLIVPFAPGGNADLTGRLYAEALARRLGQQVIVENRGGAGGAIGAEAASQSPPDGYTLVLEIGRAHV